MKFKRLFLLTCICITFQTSTTLAHSGRTDAQGGHHDYNNVSGLGSYHYHHGYPAHLHPNGICPYETASNTDTTVPQETASPEQTQENKENETAPPINIVINGKQMEADFSPQMIENRVMIPVKPIFEYFGAQVNWDITTNTITSKKNDITIIMIVDKTDYLINGTAYQMDVPPIVIDGTTFIPIRCIAESFGYSVLWNSKTNTVEILQNAIEQQYIAL